MTAIQDVLADLYEGERHLASELLRVGDRHEAEHDVFHIARDLSDWSSDHGRRLADAAKANGQDLSTGRPRPTSLSGDRWWTSQHLLGRHSNPGLVLLHDLQAIYLAASYNSLLWEILAQGAQALSIGGLLELSTSCHPETLRQIRWANTKLKESAPQVISSQS